MGQKPLIQMRKTLQTDGPFLEKWLLEPGVLKGFPMSNEKEVKDARDIWLEYAKRGSSITALYKKEPCGAANIYIQTAKKLKHQALFAILVGQKYTRQGIGTLLLNSLETLAKNTFEIETLFLEVYSENPAIHMYEKMGFRSYGKIEKYLKERSGKYYDKILMEKSLINERK